MGEHDLLYNAKSHNVGLFFSLKASSPVLTAAPLNDFRAKRLQCPFCLEEDQKKLDYFTVDSETGYQVHVCRTCKSYIKIADFRELFGRTFMPALDDLESLALDMAAQKEGFHRLAPSEWGL